MDGPSIIGESLSVPRMFGSFPLPLNYHPRSDHHSKVACWGVVFDLLNNSPLLRTHVEQNKVAFGINHSINDYAQNRKKDLDLVICTPDPGVPSKGRTLHDLALSWDIVLNRSQQATLTRLPVIAEAAVGSVLVALEAKACMTEFGKAGPRLFDELNSSQQIVHGSSSSSLAVGLVTINSADSFFSPLRNKHLTFDPTLPVDVSTHSQPLDVQRTLKRVESLPRRAGSSDQGFDALGIIVMNCPNLGALVEILTVPPAPAAGSTFHYDSMIHRVLGEYSSRFSTL